MIVDDIVVEFMVLDYGKGVGDKIFVLVVYVFFVDEIWFIEGYVYNL